MENLFGHKIKNGHGFGLMNCKGIIDKYRKTSQIFNVCGIFAESEIGKGSRFYFRLPYGILRVFLFFISLSLTINLNAEDVKEIKANTV